MIFQFLVMSLPRFSTLKDHNLVPRTIPSKQTFLFFCDTGTALCFFFRLIRLSVHIFKNLSLPPWQHKVHITTQHVATQSSHLCQRRKGMFDLKEVPVWKQNALDCPTPPRVSQPRRLLHLSASSTADPSATKIYGCQQDNVCCSQIFLHVGEFLWFRVRFTLRQRTISLKRPTRGCCWQPQNLFWGWKGEGVHNTPCPTEKLFPVLILECCFRVC